MKKLKYLMLASALGAAFVAGGLLVAVAWPAEMAQTALAAEQRTSLASERGFALAVAQFVLTLLTVAGLGLTILQTREALGQTRSSLELQRMASLAELRPYLGIQGLLNVRLLDPAGAAAVFSWEFKNFGVTPALNARRRFWMSSVDNPASIEVGELPVQMSDWITSGDIAPGASKFMDCEVHVHPPDVSVFDPMRRGMGLAVICEWRFDGPFGEDYVYRYSEVSWGHDFGRQRGVVLTGDEPFLRD